jgi:hypothetical protein
MSRRFARLIKRVRLLLADVESWFAKGKKVFVLMVEDELAGIISRFTKNGVNSRLLRVSPDCSTIYAAYC